MSSGEVDLRVWKERGSFLIFLFQFCFPFWTRVAQFYLHPPHDFQIQLWQRGGGGRHVVFFSQVASAPLPVTEAQLPPEKRLCFILMLLDTRDKQHWHWALATMKLSGMVTWPVLGIVDPISELLLIHLQKIFSPKGKCWPDGSEAWSSWSILTWREGSAQ